jgi:hypothetical protein
MSDNVNASVTTVTSAERDPVIAALTDLLSAPFPVKDIKFKPQMVKNNRALAMPYIDARLIQDRLDDVLGVENWQDRYDFLPDGSVVCRLRMKLGGRWITKTDVGSPSEQPDSGDRVKAAVSDALKRASVKFGVGRYLYRIPAQWVDYDPVKKQITQMPTMPAFAVPKPAAAPAKASPTPAVGAVVVAEKAAPPAAAPKMLPGGASEPKSDPNLRKNMPQTGTELHRRLQEYDAKLAGNKLCVRGALMAHVTQAGVKAGYSATVTDWAGPALDFAVTVVKDFEASVRGGSATRTGGAA